MISIFLLGFLVSFLGYTPPSVLNMTALKIKLKGNHKDFYEFIAGVLLIVLFQVCFSIYLTKHISKHPDFLELLEKTGIIVLFILSIYFFNENKKERKKEEEREEKKKKNSFLTGLLLSSLNVFAIPFFCGVTALLVALNLMNFENNSIFIFVIGAVIGSYYILFLYGKFAFKIQKKTGNITNKINLFLCLITAFFAITGLLKLIF